jgi:hypothetical protein
LEQKRAKAAENFRQGRLDAKALKIGTTVMLADPQHRDTKNHPPYIGPYSIAGVAHPDVYWLRDKVGRTLERPVPVDQLKVLRRAPALTYGKPPPVQDIQSDWYYVDELLGHRMRKGKHEYYVKWKGYPVSAATWESATDIDESLIQDYMRRATHVPRKEKNSKIRQ